MENGYMEALWGGITATATTPQLFEVLFVVKEILKDVFKVSFDRGLVDGHLRELELAWRESNTNGDTHAAGTPSTREWEWQCSAPLPASLTLLTHTLLSGVYGKASNKVLTTACTLAVLRTAAELATDIKAVHGVLENTNKEQWIELCKTAITEAEHQIIVAQTDAAYAVALSNSKNTQSQMVHNYRPEENLSMDNLLSTSQVKRFFSHASCCGPFLTMTMAQKVRGVRVDSDYTQLHQHRFREFLHI